MPRREWLASVDWCDPHGGERRRITRKHQTITTAVEAGIALPRP
jgi:hypothetical protein